MMRKLLIISVLALFAANISSCGGGGSSSKSDSGATSVTINIGKTSTASYANGKRLSSESGGIPSDVAAIRFTVSASDMETIRRTAVVRSGEASISETFLVPNGTDRHFLVEAMDALGSVLYKGDAHADLDGTPVSLTIVMASTAPFSDVTGTWSVFHTPAGGTEVGPDCIAFTQTGNIIIITSPDYTGAGTIYGDQIELAFATTSSASCGNPDILAVIGTVSSDGNSIDGDYIKTGGCGDSAGNWRAVKGTCTTSSGTGDISGKIIDALTGAGVSGASINLRTGKDVTTGTVVASATSQSDGSYSFTGLNSGEYTAEVSKSGYITTYYNVICVSGTTTANQNITLTPTLSSGETRIVLTWGATPEDLDSHLTGPAPDGSRFHVYFENMEYIYNGVVYALLDLDDIFSYGPETTTIKQQISGAYRFSVHDFTNLMSTNSNQLAQSGATVKVYRGNSLVATFNVPNQGGTLWTVFELNGDTITPVNTMSYEANIPNIQMPARTDTFLIRKQPKKK